MGRIIDRRRVMGGEKLPYDAEIMWLKSDRGCFVDTGIFLFDTDNFELHLRFSPTVFYNYISLFAASEDSYESWIYSNKLFAVRINNIRIDPANYVIANTLYDLQVIGENNEKLTYILNDTSKETMSAFKSKVAGSLCLFSGYGNSYGEWKFYHLKLKKDDVLVLDLIPVRVGQIGYMYDKVSKQLFGNSGTGSFILGPDKGAKNINIHVITHSTGNTDASLDVITGHGEPVNILYTTASQAPWSNGYIRVKYESSQYSWKILASTSCLYNGQVYNVGDLITNWRYTETKDINIIANI